jgi:DNA-3-methyladenine glycosylase II
MRAADTIWVRVKATCDGSVTAHTIAAASVARLRKAGLSAAKVKTLKELSKAVLKDGLNLLALRKLTYEEAAARLTRIWGIGPWTVEMFLIFSLGARDIFSPGDLALARAVEKLYGLPKNVARAELSRIAERWAPHRSFACLILWKLYEG